MAALAKPPRLPREFYERSSLGALAFIAYALGLWFVPGWVASRLVASGLPWWALVPALCVLVLMAAHGAHMLGFVGHEGFHFNLFRGRLKNAVAGVLASSPLVFFVQVGVAIDHHNHHRYTNAAGDPDLALFGRQTSFWQRLLFTRLRANRAFSRDALRLLLGRPLDMDERDLPLGRGTFRKLALLNFVCCAAWLALYVQLARRDPSLIVFGVVLPLAAGTLLSGLRPYLEHTDTDDQLKTSARSRTHPWFVLWYFGNSLHLEHHLYPSVPCYRLARVRRWLLAQNFYDGEACGVEPRLVASYRWASGLHAYGPARLRSAP